MIRPNNLPASYDPYNIVRLCSNTLEGGAHLFEVSGTLPLLIGQGEQPVVWLSASTGPGKMVDIVTASKPVHPDVAVTDAFGGTVVMVGSEKVLSLKELNNNEIEIDFLDLRPIGLNIFGNKTDGLTIGTNKFVGNNFKGIGTFIKID